MYRVYPDLTENFKRYVSGGGSYPYRCSLLTPQGTVTPNLYSYHDLFTVHEIFCRQVYYADSSAKVVVDVGSNIGISALYFLTRNATNHCYLFEPDPNNIPKLKANLAQYVPRIDVSENAVGDLAGTFRFGLEETGRYGGIGLPGTQEIEVHCFNINDVLKQVLDTVDVVDILKIDTEGLELKTVKAIDESFCPRIRKIYFEGHTSEQVHPRFFTQRLLQSDVCELTNRKL